MKIKYLFQLIKFKIKYPTVKFYRGSRLKSAFSQEGQDLLMEKYFNRLFTTDDVIFDIGCNHPLKYSNSAFFDFKYQCKVFAIDPVSSFKSEWKKLRPNTNYLNLAVSSSQSSIQFNVVLEDTMFSSSSELSIKKYRESIKIMDVPSKSLSAICSEFGIQRIKILFIDVEGMEFDVLKSLDFSKIIVDSICLENNSFDLYGDDEIRNYLKENNFKFVSRIGHLDDIFVRKY